MALTPTKKQVNRKVWRNVRSRADKIAAAICKGGAILLTDENNLNPRKCSGSIKHQYKLYKRDSEK